MQTADSRQQTADSRQQTAGSESPFRRVFFPVVLAGVFFLGACAAPVLVAEPAQSNGLNAAPQLARFNRFELISQSRGTVPEQQVSGTLEFQNSGAMFDVRTAIDPNAGRFTVQPDACRDDPSEDCARRFVISGRLSALGTSVNCFIGVRNDTAVGYQAQSLTGICQDRYARTFAITLFSN